MTIKPSPSRPDRIVSPGGQEEEIMTEISLRPRRLDEYVGQKQIKEHLTISIESARIRKAPLEHILFYGPP
jgi:Holliday junction DNA helicase RuvB